MTRRLVLVALLVAGCHKSSTAVSDGGIPDGGLPDGQLDACWLGNEPRFDAGQSFPPPAGTVRDFFGVWGNRHDDVYAVGTGASIWHWDGHGWFQSSFIAQPPVAGDLLGVWGDASDDVYAVGLGGTIMHFNSSWLPQTGPVDDAGLFTTDLHAVSGGKSSEPWAVGANGLMIHSTNQGATWTRVDVPTQETLNGIWIARGGAAGAAVGNLGTILTYDGSTWTRQRITGLTAHLKGVWGSDATHIYAAGLDGTLVSNVSGTWQTMTPTALLPRDPECQQASTAWPSVYLRNMTGRNGRIYLVGWNGTIAVLTNSGAKATLYQITPNRLESAWATSIVDTPGQGDGGIPDAGLATHDEVTIVGVTGTIIKIIVP